jgi:hypothetical protein
MWSMGLVIVVALTTVFFLAIPPSLAEESLTQAPLVGEVRKIYPAEGYLVLKGADGKRQRIDFTEETAFKGVFLAEEIKEKQKIKVWYVLDQDAIRAVKIEVKPELGC